MSGRIKANIGARVCFATASAMDSQIVIEQPGAEKLAGKGDMLYLYPGQEPIRLQSFYI
jgi:S-DNA-T family DNA segregation ATPase FtsK/SpoIIIE